ncbi:hypothetical protein R1flu_019114 [Riccia fluitans]|uniref:Protein FAM32A n=1 Tax=Riccia fluitans TaxID=41844 RepID=A0ABD1ZHR1_9MARC
MSYNNVMGGKLKLKGKALDVKAGGMKKKKKKSNESFEQALLQLKEKGESEQGSDADVNKGSSVNGDEEQGGGGNERQLTTYEDHRTPAEKKYHEQRMVLETKRLAKVASKSHRQKIEEFNQYLANLSEHYDIPKVGPG